MFLAIAAGVITVAVFVAIVRRVEVRLALLTGGLAMAVLSLNPQAWSNAFLSGMTISGLITVILPVMGFAAVMELTGCDRHLVHLVTRPLSRVGPFLVPGAMLATFVINTALPSAAGCAAAVGVVLIPTMMAAGVHPALAAAAVLAGTWGSIFSPGSAHPAVIADISKVSVMDVILAHRAATIPAMLLIAALLFAESLVLHEGAGASRRPVRTIAGGSVDTTVSAPRIDVVRALIPMVPLALLLLTVPQFHLTTRWLPGGFSVLEAMTIGVFLGMLVTMMSPTKVTQSFFDGMGRAYGNVMGIIIAATVFVGGLDAAGGIKALIAAMTSVKWAVPVAGTWGPMLLAVLSGSGDAATLAFNKAVTIHAAQFGISPVALGNLAWIGGALGRSMSPVAAAAIIAAGFAKVSPFELAKRNAVPMVAAAVLTMMVLGR
ncbi:MAG TPA: C4-dicarboxylate transporter DcuC [bacterium]|nr:C4-dicarboxylate transporter DcuC [bacterium]